MRFRGAYAIGLLAAASMAWFACGGDDAAVDNSSDASTSDSTTGGDSGSGGDSGNTNDSGNTGDSGSSCDAGPFPSLPAGEIFCPGDPQHECDSDAATCCNNHCQARGTPCSIGNDFIGCERASDCKGKPCCLRLQDDAGVDTTTCPAEASGHTALCTDTTCSSDTIVMCASSAECDSGVCTPLLLRVDDGGTTVGICVP